MVLFIFYTILYNSKQQHIFARKYVQAAEFSMGNSFLKVLVQFILELNFLM